MAGMAVKGVAAIARASLPPSPMASAQSTATAQVTAWLKITALPLLVFLIGACLWGCIKNTPAWRMLTEGGGGSTHNEADQVSADSSRSIADLEEGLELSQGCRNRHISVDSKCTPTDDIVRVNEQLAAPCKAASEAPASEVGLAAQSKEIRSNPEVPIMLEEKSSIHVQ